MAQKFTIASHPGTRSAQRKQLACPPRWPTGSDVNYCDVTCNGYYTGREAAVEISFAASHDESVGRTHSSLSVHTLNLVDAWY